MFAGITIVTALFLSRAGLAAPSTQPASAAIDNPMFADPVMPPITHVFEFNPQDKPLWLAALARPDAETRRQAADAIGLAASQGMPDLADTADKIAATLESDDRPIVRQSCVQALARLDASQLAATLLKYDGDDWQTMLVADAALAKWDYQPAYKVWRSRLTDPHASEQSVRSALRAIGASGILPDDYSTIGAIATDPTRSQSLRLQAAEVLSGSADKNEVFISASAGVSSKRVVDRLVSAMMLGSLSGQNASQFLLKLADDSEPMVVAIAARKLMKSDVKLLAPLDAKLAGSDDFAVRTLAVEIFTAQRTDDSIRYLAKLLDDSDPKIRSGARDAMLALSSDASLAHAVSEGAAATIAGSDWRGIEQALLLLGSTGDHRADDRIVQLLSDDRAALRIASVVAVRRLRIVSALPALAERLASIASTMKTAAANAKVSASARLSEADFANLGDEGSQIGQALGLMDYKPADATLRFLIDKEAGYAWNTRTAGIWALGRLHAGVPDEGLVGQLMDRATDHSIMMPEVQDVQVMSVEAIGMMRATSAAKPLQQIIETNAGSDSLLNACRWSIGQITGQPPQPSPTRHVVRRGFFLESVR